jgi:hypothetical protein
MAPKFPKDSPPPAAGQRSPRTAGRARYFEDDEQVGVPEERQEAKERAALEEHRRQQDKEFALLKARRKKRERQEKMVRRWLRRPIDGRRRYFTMAEIAGKLAPLRVEDNGQFGADSQACWEATKRLATFMVAGRCNDRGGIIVLGSGAPPLTGAKFKKAWNAAIDLETKKPYPAFLKVCCITREGATAFFGDLWPAEWGAPARSSRQPADGGGPAQRTKRDVDVAYKGRITEGRYPTIAEDEAWRKEVGLSRPRMRELRAKHRPVAAKKGGAPKGRRGP